MYCRTMKAMKNFFLGTLTIFLFSLDDVAAEKFSIPAEVLNKYLNISKDELYENCERRNMHCLTAIGLETLEVIEQKNGEQLIELLIKRASQDPPLNEELWQKEMDRHCHQDIVFQTLLDIGFNKVFQCVPDIIQNNKEGLGNVRHTYSQIYCERVERIAKYEISRRKH